jgi:FemAB-related protein (PEP-CTERM system-associated)
MNIRLANQPKDPQLWDDFVERSPDGSNYHRWNWKRVIEESFHWPTFYFLAEENGVIQGILPIVWQKSWVFGSFLTSLPFLNGGGILATKETAKDGLVAEATALAKGLRVDHLELRHRVDPRLTLPTKLHKVAMILQVDADSEKMWSALSHKVRTDIRKGIKSGLAAELGGQELLNDFYEVFARNMRDLGTPVYSRGFFRTTLSAFPNENFICVVRHKGKPVAASFLLGYRQTVEAGWSAARYDYLAMRPNMFLYWNILDFAARRGYREFDFGRSSVGSGTYRFKKQWGARELSLFWAYWVPNGAKLPEVNKENPRYELAIKCWQKLPVSFTKLLGPSIVKCLP